MLTLHPASSRLMPLNPISNDRRSCQRVTATLLGCPRSIPGRIRAVSARQRQPVKYRRVQHSQPMQLRSRSVVFVAHNFHRFGHPSPPRTRTRIGKLTTASQRHARVRRNQSLQPTCRLVKVPYWNPAFLKRPFSQQVVVGCFVSINHVGNDRPLKRWVSSPFIHEFVIPIPISNRVACSPRGKCTVINNERLANFRRRANVFLTPPRYQCVSASKKTCHVFSASPAWCSVVMNHAGLNVSLVKERKLPSGNFTVHRPLGQTIETTPLQPVAPSPSTSTITESPTAKQPNKPVKLTRLGWRFSTSVASLEAVWSLTLFPVFPPCNLPLTFGCITSTPEKLAPQTQCVPRFHPARISLHPSM